MKSIGNVPNLFLPLLLAGAAFGMFVLTGARTIQWQDSAQFTYRIAAGELENSYGLAMAHPLHFWLGRLAAGLFPDQVPWAVSGVSALGGAVAVGLVVWIVQRITREVKAAFFAGVSLMLAHTFWRFSGLPEVYTLSAALLLGQMAVYLTMDWDEPSLRKWALLFGLNGLSLANHNMALLALPTWGVLWLLTCWKHPGFWKSVPVLALTWLAGSLPYTGWVFIQILHADAWMPVVRSALFGHSFADQVTSLQFEGFYAFISIGFLVLSLPIAGLLALWALRVFRTSLWPLLTLLGTHLIFFLRYNVIDQYTFFIPAMALVAVLGGLGFSRLNAPRVRNAALVLVMLQPVLYAVTPSLVRVSGVMDRFARNKPYRDDANYLFRPWQVQERSAHRMAAEAFELVGDQGILVVEDSMAMYTLKWMRLHLDTDAVQIMPVDAFSEDLLTQEPSTTVIRIPKRTDSPVPEGWQRSGFFLIPDKS